MKNSTIIEIKNYKRAFNYTIKIMYKKISNTYNIYKIKGKKENAMQEEYTREYKIIEKTEQEKELELIENIIKVKEELKMARKNFEFASEEELIDYYTYQIKANQSKLDYLIKIAKAKGIVIDMIKEVKIRLYNNEKTEVV